MIEVVEPDSHRAENEPGRERHYELPQFVRQLGQRIALLRRERGLSQAAFVDLHGYHLSHWQKIEQGRKMSLPTLLRIANDLGVTVEDLVRDISRVDGPAPSPRSVRRRYGHPARDEQIEVE